MALSNASRFSGIYDQAVPRVQLMGQAMSFAVWAGVTVVGAVLRPNPVGHGTHEQLGMPPCPSVLLFDRPCPGCGLTTSWSATIHGNLPFAFHAHPLGPLTYLLFTAFALLAGYGFLSGGRLRTYTNGFNRLSAIIAVVFIGFGLIRFATTPHFASKLERALYGYPIARP